MSKKFILSVFCLSFLLAAFRFADDIIARLGLSQQTARYYVLNNFLGNYNSSFEEGDEGGDPDSDYNQMQSFRIPYSKLLPSIITGDKAGAARDLCIYVKQYCNSRDFMDDYNKKREACKPTSEPFKPDEETIKAMRKEYESAKKDFEKMKKSGQLNKETQSSYEAGLKSQADMLAQWEDPHPNLTKWEKQFPADPADLIKARLQEYLTLVATVDFNAQLSEPDKYKIRKFINPAYEKRSLKWKACFRAGKEVNEVVTAFVKDWLKGPILSANKESMPVTEPDQKNAVPVKSGPTPAIRQPSAVTDTIPAPASKKKSLFNKIKDKAKNVIRD